MGGDSQDSTLGELIGFSPDRCEEMLRAALECYAESDFAQAETILAGLIALSDRDPRPFKLLASTLAVQGRHVAAERLYERAYDIEPDDPYTLVALGEIKLKALNLDEAIPLFERLFALDPDGTLPPANRGRELVKEAYARLKGG